jgi:uncharacterized protein
VADGPRLDRSLTLHFQGDWGGANLHRVCGWLSQTMGERCGPYSRFAIWNGKGWADAPRAVGRGLVDVALATPAAFAAMAYTGRGPYADESYPFLRALGSVPQNDRLVLAVGAEHGVRSFADLRERRVPLRIATSADDGVNFIGLAVARILELEGVPPAAVESWGGSFLYHEQPINCVTAARERRADAVFHEAIMTPPWQALADERDVHLIPIDGDVLDQLERAYGWPRASLPAGYLRGLDAPLETLDFSDFLLMVRADLPEEIAYLLAWCLGEQRARLERYYRHLPSERSPVTYPLDPAKMARTPIPLHPGAERYYREYGYL